MATPNRDRMVVISCKGSKTLRRQIVTLAKQAQRTPSDWLRLTLSAIVKRDGGGLDAPPRP